MADPVLLITGRHFGREGLRGVMPVMQELVRNARNEIHILAYVITRQAMPLLQELEAALSRGVKVTLVVNVIQNQRVELEVELRRMTQPYPHAVVRYFDEEDGSQLHAKALVADRDQAVVGSANYTWGGLVGNHEIGVLLSGRPAWELARLADKLALHSPGAPRA